MHRNFHFKIGKWIQKIHTTNGIRELMIKAFELSDGKKLKLSEYALTHIVEGNFSVRPIKDQDNMEVLSGGLHTYEGWVNFKNKYTHELEHLHYYNSDIHRYWYYARELSNGVITLRLPKDLFTGRAAKITMYPDDYYKSGYLWKTLFPKSYSKTEILEAIDEAIRNEDISQRKNGKIVGYINKDDPLKTIKLEILYRGNQINSVYPAWTQPNTGNNGKPFSHYENIGFIISQSTEYFDVDKNPQEENFYTFSGTEIKAEDLPIHTPDIFKNRTPPNGIESPLIWAKNRITELKSITLNDKENDLIFRYLNDFNLVKHYPELITGVYTHCLKGLTCNIGFYNTFQIVQNFIDGLNYLFLKGQHERLTKTIVYFLENMVSHTLYDLLSKKRILSTIIKIVTSANNPELSYKFIEALSPSPIRRELYLEYNVNSLNKKKISVPVNDFPDELHLIDNPNLDINLSVADFVEILKETFGETYTLNFSDVYLNKHFDVILSNQEGNYKKLISDSLVYFNRDDFISLSDHINEILTSALKHGDIENLSKYAGLILRDYCRIQFAHRLRINARYIDYHQYAHADSIYLPLDHDLLYGTILKHERLMNQIKLEYFTEGMLKFSQSISDSALENDTNNFIKKIAKEKPPLPEKIPSMI